jgi:hypothetical protein
MSSPEAIFIEQRAQILAMVQFTSRSDLQVTSLDEHSGLDLLVRITSANEGHQDLFGVILKGTTDLLSDRDAATRHLESLSRKRADWTAPTYSFPVVVLLFSMPNDKGFYAWRIEPTLKGMREPRLKVHDGLSCDNFDRKSLDKIVKKVAEWHERLFTLLAEV